MTKKIIKYFLEKIYRFLSKYFLNKNKIIDESYHSSDVKLIYPTNFGFYIFVHKEKLADIITNEESCDSESMMRAFTKIIENENIAFDVGSNIGITTLWLSEKIDKVYSFEPDLNNFNAQKANIKLNNKKNITQFNIALSDHDGTQEFFVRKSFGHHGFLENHTTTDQHKIEVEVKKLDTILYENGIESIDVLKIDVEGFEEKILYGAKNALKERRVKKIIFEYSPKLLDLNKLDKNSIFKILDNFDYQFYNLNLEKIIKFPPDEQTDILAQIK